MNQYTIDDDQPMFELIEIEVPNEVHHASTVGSPPTEDEAGADDVE